MQRPDKVAIVGVGLIGGSIGLAIRSRNAATQVIGVDLDPSRLDHALNSGAIDVAATDLAAGVSEADLVVICAPVTATVPLVVEASRFCPESALITDVGSTKSRIVAEVEADRGARARFVGSHPIAGSERQGVEHSRADLFDGRTCVLTPTSRTSPDRLRRARDLWASLGANVLEIDPRLHDTQLALTSHLPHVLAAALAGVIPPELFPVAGGAYRDGTRVAGSEGVLWSGIFLDNRDSLLDALSAFDGEIREFREALETGDHDRLVTWWARGRGHRLAYLQARPDQGTRQPNC